MALLKWPSTVQTHPTLIQESGRQTMTTGAVVTTVWSAQITAGLKEITTGKMAPMEDPRITQMSRTKASCCSSGIWKEAQDMA